MNVLVIGGGGREHALAWKLAQSPKVQMVYVAPGNGGTASDVRLKNINITDIKALREWAQQEKIGLTVVGPEGPLAAGVVMNSAPMVCACLARPRLRRSWKAPKLFPKPS